MSNSITTNELANTVMSMTYVSQLLWHFVRDSKSTDGKIMKSSFAVLEEYILFGNGNGLLKRYPNPKATPPWDKFYVRNLVLEVRGTTASSMKAKATDLEKIEMSSITEPQEYWEPRSVCFADIPFNFLPVHMERYSGIGLGFRRKQLSENFEDLKPVTYVPRLSQTSIGHHIEEGSKSLKAYIKVESVADLQRGIDGEPFELIYREREWRSLSDVSFDASVLACIVFRNVEELDLAYKSEKFKPFLNSKVAFLNREDFFEKPKDHGDKS